MTGEPATGPSARRLPRPGRTALGLAAVLAAVLACVPKAVSADWAFFQRDIGGYWYPMVSTFVRAVADGGLPLWDPFEGFGQPLWADPGQQAAYPPTWLNLLVLPETAYKLLLVGHLFAGGAGAFALLRRFGLGVVPATAAGIAFACSGPFVSAGSLIHHMCGAAWIGWVLWAFEGVLARGARRDVGLLALALGGQALAGSAEACTMTALLVLLRWAEAAVGDWRTAVRRIAPAAGAGAVGLLLMAAQWLPTAALVGQSSRRQFPFDFRLVASVHPAALADALVPRLVAGTSMGDAVRAAVFDGREPFLASLYLGIATLPLVALSLASGRRQRRWAWLAFGVLLLLALGRHAAPARWLLGLPPLSMFRYPSKYYWAASFAWAVLVGLGVDVWCRSWIGRERALARASAAILLALAAALAVGGWRAAGAPAWFAQALQVPDPWRGAMAAIASSKLLAASGWLAAASLLLAVRAARPDWTRASALAVTAAVAADLSSAGRPVNPLAPAALLRHRPPLVDPVLPGAAEARLYSAGVPAETLNRRLTRGPAGWEPEWRFALGVQEMLSAPLGSRWGIRGSFDPDFTGLAPTAQTLVAGLVLQYQDTPLGVRLLQMGNVGWVIGAYAGLPEVARAQSVFDDPLVLRRVPDPLPPCYVVGRTTHVPSDDDGIRRIASSDFDPRAEAVLAGEGPDLWPTAGFRGAAEYRERRAGRLRIETAANGPGLLVVSEAYDRDWQASLDGAAVPVERANVRFRGVRVPAGRHLVEMTYAPRTVAWGLAASALGLLAALVLLWPVRRAV